MRPAWWPVALLACVACGRIGFAPTSGAPGDGLDGDSGGDAFVRRDALGTGIDGATDRPNVAFVTSATTNGAMGGVAGADAMCATAAMNAGLPGTFVAFLSSQAEAASDRLVGSRGWVRTGDGAPVADTVDSMMAGAIFNGIDRDERGNKLATPKFVWAGSTTIGGSVDNCSEWTGTSLWGNFGFLGGAMPEMIRPWDVYTFGCSGQASIMCFEVGHAVAVTPVITTGLRLAFMAPPGGARRWRRGARQSVPGTSRRRRPSGDVSRRRGSAGRVDRLALHRDHRLGTARRDGDRDDGGGAARRERSALVRQPVCRRQLRARARPRAHRRTTQRQRLEQHDVQQLDVDE